MRRGSLIALLCCALPILAAAQLSSGGFPASFGVRAMPGPEYLVLSAPGIEELRAQDETDEKNGSARRVAVDLPATTDLLQNINQALIFEGITMIRTGVASPGALAMSLCFDDYRLPEGVSLFVYDDEGTHVLGAFGAANNRPDGSFATGLVPGDSLIIEINILPGSPKDFKLRLGSVSHLYRDFPDFLGRGVSDTCEVNINCPEGDNWQKQKRGVARIYVKKGGGYFWCTGSLVNNTRKDLSPLFLTADHCAPEVSPDDLSKWVFYFKYEAPGCENPATNPEPLSLTGAMRLASAGTSGSDFLLVLLNDEVPESYEPFYNGWSAESIAPPNGVTIHHPNGDIRKISTYTEPPVSSQWGGVPGTHWQVVWAPTVTNWGVTEGGSSGAPLFDNSGKIIGTLTGGLASCAAGNGGSGPDQPDYYGKFSYSWDQNGTEPSLQLRAWLDPDFTGTLSLAGMSAQLTAAFESDEQLVLIGDEVTFTNLSSGLPSSWQWTFEGGEPSSYSGPQPPPVKYRIGGRYDVSLAISDGTESDTVTISDYIQVVGSVYPNPAVDYVHIYLDADLPARVHAEIFSTAGQLIYSTEIPEHLSRLVTLDVSTLPSGMYYARIQVKDRYIFARFLKLQRQ